MDGQLGNRNKQLRLKAGLTRAELAQELKVSTALISAYELGERKPSLDLLAGLADVFGVSSDYLLGLKHHVLYEIEGLSSEEIQVVRKLICLLQMRQYDRKKI